MPTISPTPTKTSSAWPQVQTIRLSQAEQIAFAMALLDPPAPGPRLRQAADWYREQIASGRLESSPG